MKINRVLIMSLISMLTISCSLSHRMLYYPQEIAPGRLQHIRDTFENVSELRIEAEGRVMLHGWLIRKDLDMRPTIIYFGGNGEEVSLNIEPFNTRLDANVLLMNYRGYGLSEGKPSEVKLRSDAETIYNELKSRLEIKKENIIVMGRSLGSGIAAHLAVKKLIDKLILITPYDSIKEVAYTHFPKVLVNSVLSDTYDTLQLTPQLKAKTLFMVAEKDEVIPPKHAYNLYDHLVAPKKLVLIKSSGHNNITQFPQYWLELKNFLKSIQFLSLHD